jgi:hypothetical protein
VYRKFAFHEDVQALCVYWCEVLRELGKPWGLKGVEEKPMSDPRMNPASGVGYRMGGPVKDFRVNFSNRNRTRDEGDTASIDDRMLVIFDARNRGSSLRYVFDEVIPVYLRSLNAYWLAVEDGDLLHRDAVAMRELPYHDRKKAHDKLNAASGLRGDLYRIHQVNYWAREQCDRYFGLTPQQVVEHLADHVARACVLHDGAYIICSYDPMDAEQVRQLSPLLLPLLETPDRCYELDPLTRCWFLKKSLSRVEFTTLAMVGGLQRCLAQMAYFGQRCELSVTADIELTHGSTQDRRQQGHPMV